MRVLATLTLALISGHTAGQFTVTGHTLDGFWSIGAQGNPGTNINDNVSTSGSDGLNFTRETRYDDPSGVSATFIQSYSTVVTADSLTFSGSLRVTEFFTAVPDISPSALFSWQSHLIGGSIQFSLPEEMPVRITGILRHEPMVFPAFGDPTLQNGTVMNLGLVGSLIADAVDDPFSGPVDTIDEIVNMSAGGIQFQSDHRGGANSPLGLADVSWEITYQIVPAPAAVFVMPFGLALASRRRR